MASKCNSRSGWTPVRGVRPRRALAQLCAGLGVGGMLLRPSAESHLGEAHWGQQDLGALPSAAQPAAQRRVPPNHSFGLTCLGWSPAPAAFSHPSRPLGPHPISLRGAPASPASPGHGARLAEEVGSPPTEQPWPRGRDSGRPGDTCEEGQREGSSPPQVQGKNRNGTEHKGKMKVMTGTVRGASTPSQTLLHRVAAHGSGHPLVTLCWNQIRPVRVYCD